MIHIFKRAKTNKFLLLIVIILILVTAWRLEAVDYFLVRTVFAPDYPGLRDGHEGEGRYAAERIPPLDYYVATNDRDGRGLPDETSDLILKIEFPGM